jgi:hypothetical protein
MAPSPLLGGLALLLATCQLPTATAPSYYLSSSHGADTNNGSSASSPWRTLRRANQTALEPGDSLLLRRGDVWRGEVLLLPAARGTLGRSITIASYGDASAARPLLCGLNKSTDIPMILDAASYVAVRGLAFSTAKVGLYLRYWQSYGSEAISITDCLFSDIDDPEFDPYTMARQGTLTALDISWSSGIMVGGQLRSIAEPGVVLSGLNVSNTTFANCAVGLQVAVGNWNSPGGGPGNPLPFSRVEGLHMSDVTQVHKTSSGEFLLHLFVYFRTFAPSREAATGSDRTRVLG